MSCSSALALRFTDVANQLLTLFQGWVSPSFAHVYANLWVLWIHVHAFRVHWLNQVSIPGSEALWTCHVAPVTRTYPYMLRCQAGRHGWGQAAWIYPNLSIFCMWSPTSTTHPKLVELIRNNQNMHGTWCKSSYYSREVDGQNGK